MRHLESYSKWLKSKQETFVPTCIKYVNTGKALLSFNFVTNKIVDKSFKYHAVMQRDHDHYYLYYTSLLHNNLCISSQN